jgi:hypothetical protein
MEQHNLSQRNTQVKTKNREEETTNISRGWEKKRRIKDKKAIVD